MKPLPTRESSPHLICGQPPTLFRKRYRKSIKLEKWLPEKSYNFFTSRKMNINFASDKGSIIVFFALQQRLEKKSVFLNNEPLPLRKSKALLHSAGVG